jgi:hypothetical protein
MVEEVTTLKADACFSNYPDIISDHRPVFLKLK